MVNVRLAARATKGLLLVAALSIFMALQVTAVMSLIM
jgi:hypothetical protein